MRDVRAYLPAILLCAGCALSLGVRPQQTAPATAGLSTLPSPVEGYVAENRSISDEERRVAGMSDYVMRVYRDGSLTAFTVYVGYYDRQTQGHAIHSPRNCLPGAGWEIVTRGTRDITVDGRNEAVNRYVLGKGKQRAVVYYWYQGRGRIESSEYAVKWNLLRDAAIYGRTEEAIVRIVIPVTEPPGSDRAKLGILYGRADALAESVARRLLGDVARVLPEAPGLASRRAATAMVDGRAP